MSNKYYIPTIEEFHIGINYQKFNHINGKWENEILDLNDFITILDEEINDYSEHDIRIKYLDSEDIESLGFEKAVYRLQDCYKYDNYVLHWFERPFVSIDVINHNKGNIILDATQVFRGTIKNKSELKKLLVQLGVL